MYLSSPGMRLGAAFPIRPSADENRGRHRDVDREKPSNGRILLNFNITGKTDTFIYRISNNGNFLKCLKVCIIKYILLYMCVCVYVY